MSVAVGWCGSSSGGAQVGSDAALLGAVASGGEVLALRAGRWTGEDAGIAGATIQRVAPPLGRPGLAGGLIRRRVAREPVPVWAEPEDTSRLRGFARAAMPSTPRSGLDRVAGSLLERRESSKEHDGIASVVVLCSHPGRLEARGVVFATTLAAVAGRRTRAIVPRGIRAADSGRRYLRGLGPIATLEVTSGPSWLELPRADAVLVDVSYERSTRFGGLLLDLAEAMGIEVVDLPGHVPVGARDARRYGLPLVEALERSD